MLLVGVFGCMFNDSVADYHVDEGFEKTVINHKRGSFVAYNLAIR
jgi:hypothetical protein